MCQLIMFYRWINKLHKKVVAKEYGWWVVTVSFENIVTESEQSKDELYKENESPKWTDKPQRLLQP